VINFARAPPQAGPYQGLKDRLLQAFGRTPMERANAIMNWPELGVLKPLALYDKMAATLSDGSDCDHILVKACFIRQLPPDVQDHLSDKMEQSTRAIAAAADRFFASYGTHQNPTAGVANAVEYKSCNICMVKKIGGFSRGPLGTSRMERTSTGHMPGGATRGTPAKAVNASWQAVRLQ
jgi:hypothetical protein